MRNNPFKRNFSISNVIFASFIFERKKINVQLLTQYLFHYKNIVILQHILFVGKYRGSFYNSVGRTVAEKK